MKRHASTVKITIDGKKHTVPFEVHNVLNKQREAINYYMHVLAIWYYKFYENDQKELSKDYIHEFAKFIEENVEELANRIETFKNVDKKR